MHGSIVFLNSLLIAEMSFSFVANITSAIIVYKSGGSPRLNFINTVLMLLFVSHVFAVIAHSASHFTLINTTDMKLKTIVTAVRDFFVGIVVNFSGLLSFVRFFSIYKPFLYERMTKTHGIITIVLIVLLVVSYTIWRHFSSAVHFLIVITSNIASMGIIACNIYLYRSVKRQCNQIASTIVTISQQEQKRQRSEMQKLSLKSLKMSIWVSASFYITFVPSVIFLFVKRVLSQSDGLHSNHQKLSEHPNAGFYLDFLSLMVFISNGIWDVLIFYKYNTDARRQLKRFLRRFKKDGTLSNQVSYSNNTSNIETT